MDRKKKKEEKPTVDVERLLRLIQEQKQRAEEEMADRSVIDRAIGRERILIVSKLQRCIIDQ